MDEIVVAIGVPTDETRARILLTHGRRLAGRIGARWVAFRVYPQSVDPSRDTSTRRLHQIVAMQGGVLVCAAARDDAEGLAAMAAREHADVLVVGPSRRSRLLRRWLPGVAGKLLRARHRFDLVVANPEGSHD